MTTAANPLPPHGSLSRLKHHGCKCDACRKADRDYVNTRSRLIAYGRWQPYVDAEPVRQHVRMLMSYGIGLQRVRALAGIPNGTMSKLLYGDGRRGLQPSKRVRTETAEKILAVRASLDAVAPSALIDGTGTRRRLQALVAVGWPQIELARLTGLDKLTINEQVHALVTTAYAATARTVRDLYDQLWNVDPASRGVARRWIDQARALAAANGWVPPAAWDDDYIDSPAAVPDMGARVPRYIALAENGLELERTQGYTRQQAADRLGVSKDALQQAISRYRAAQADQQSAAA